MNAAPDIHAEATASTRMWETFLNACTIHFGDGENPAAKKTFSAQGLTSGVLSRATTQRVRSALASCKMEAFNTGSCASGFIASKLFADEVSVLSQHNTYYRLSTELLWNIWDVLDEIAVPIFHAIGQPWRVLAVRGWRTTAGAPESGPNAWHVDGLPKEMLKCMVYFTPIGPGLGGVNFLMKNGQHMSLTGPDGSWVLFQNSIVQHKGVGPVEKDSVRDAFEITLAPSYAFALQPRHTGQNARHPKYPWTSIR